MENTNNKMLSANIRPLVNIDTVFIFSSLELVASLNGNLTITENIEFFLFAMYHGEECNVAPKKKKWVGEQARKKIWIWVKNENAILYIAVCIDADVESNTLKCTLMARGTMVLKYK